MLFASGFLFAASLVADSAEPEPLSVMTWNLEWFYDEYDGDGYSKLAREKAAPDRDRWNWRRDAVARSIASARPTIVALQEVENRRVLWYLSRAIERAHQLRYREFAIQSRDHYTEQDVGMLVRQPAELLKTSQFVLTDRLRQTGRYYDITKHLLAVLDFPTGDQRERVTLLNVHLRSGIDGESERKRQARLLQHWIGEIIRRGDNVIVLGDFNTEERADQTRRESDLGILSGGETLSSDDDLIDLHLKLPVDQRQTHLLPGRQFDHIFCSPSLLEDDPTRPDLVFDTIRLRRDLVVRGALDTPQQHWEQYWELPDDQRDLSDHFPLVATFVVR